MSRFYQGEMKINSFRQLEMFSGLCGSQMVRFRNKGILGVNITATNYWTCPTLTVILV